MEAHSTVTACTSSTACAQLLSTESTSSSVSCLLIVHIPLIASCAQFQLIAHTSPMKLNAQPSSAKCKTHLLSAPGTSPSPAQQALTSLGNESDLDLQN